MEPTQQEGSLHLPHFRYLILPFPSLAGMLHKVGLLPAGNFQQLPFAYKMFKRADDVGWEQSTEFKKAFAVDVPIEFIGVWFVLCLVKSERVLIARQGHR